MTKEKRIGKNEESKRRPRWRLRRGYPVIPLAKAQRTQRTQRGRKGIRLTPL